MSDTIPVVSDLDHLKIAPEDVRNSAVDEEVPYEVDSPEERAEFQRQLEAEEGQPLPDDSEIG